MRKSALTEDEAMIAGENMISRGVTQFRNFGVSHGTTEVTAEDDKVTAVITLIMTGDEFFALIQEGWFSEIGLFPMKQ